MSSSRGVWNPEVSVAIRLFSAQAKEGAKEHFGNTRLLEAVRPSQRNEKECSHEYHPCHPRRL
jgi:hypothetical protein